MGARPLSLSEARTAQSLRLERAGFYQIHFANGRDAVIGVNPDRRESDLAPMPPDVPAALERQFRAAVAAQPQPPRRDETKYRTVSLWWYVMLLALVAAMAETALASGYMGTQREEV